MAAISAARRRCGRCAGGVPNVASRACCPEGGRRKQIDADTNVPDKIAEGTAVMTSACWSPLLERRIGIGFVDAQSAAAGDTVRLGGGARARVARLPFYDPVKVLPRRAR